MLRGFAKSLVIEAGTNLLKALPALIILTIAIWLIAGMLLSCSAKLVDVPVEPRHYLCERR